MTDPVEIMNALLDYIAWLETHGGYAMEGGGVGKPVDAAARYIEEHSK